ncbi:MAG: hypothetical protein HP496_12745 [Nitrospira sp.]|nr:hypothetical protein [Nitrospira sp.]
MPVNMDPSKKRRRPHATTASVTEDGLTDTVSTPPRQSFGEETETDREKDLADAELKNLWDATEVIDMDKI